VLSTIKNDAARLKRAYRILFKNVTFLSFVMMSGMAAVAGPMVETLIGTRWLPVVPYVQLLCLSGMPYPLHALNLNILKVSGRSDLNLSLAILKKILIVPVVVVGVLWGIKVMIIGMFAHSIVSYLINSYWSGRLIDYPMKEQLKDIFPSIYVSAAMGIVVWCAGLLMHYSPLLVLLLQLLLGGCIVLGISSIIHHDAYVDLREIVRNMSDTKPNTVDPK
jgi:O-antigen/teichoic acid export membrane protein